MCPLTGRALPSAQLKCQHAVFCSAWQEACSGCPLMTLKHLLLSGKWISLSGALSSFFSNWINWSNRRLSYSPCHAFYLWLIALYFPASFCLLGVSSPLSSTPSRHLFVFPLSAFLIFLYSVWPLFAPEWLKNEFYGGNWAFQTLVFKEVLISHPVQSAALPLLFPLGVLTQSRMACGHSERDRKYNLTYLHTLYNTHKQDRHMRTIHTHRLIHRMWRNLLPWWMHGCVYQCLTVAFSCYWFTSTENHLHVHVKSIYMNI